jgi:anti-sigma28 factor (negative regulator of flagellin synthesis)
MRTIKKPKTMGVKKVSQKKSVKELELDLQQLMAEEEQGVGGVGNAERINALKRAIRKLK